VLCLYGLPYLLINPWQATALLQLRFPDLEHHDPTPIHLALWGWPLTLYPKECKDFSL
jgi:hypothetical protein